MGVKETSSFDSLVYELNDLGVGCEIKPMQQLTAKSRLS